MKKMNRCLLVVFVLITVPSHAMLTRLSRVAAVGRGSSNRLVHASQQRTYKTHVQRPTINVIPAKNQTIPKENVPLNLTAGAQRSSGYLSWIVASLCGLFGWSWYLHADADEQEVETDEEKIVKLIDIQDDNVINLLRPYLQTACERNDAACCEHIFAELIESEWGYKILLELTELLSQKKEDGKGLYFLADNFIFNEKFLSRIVKGNILGNSELLVEYFGKTHSKSYTKILTSLLTDTTIFDQLYGAHAHDYYHNICLINLLSHTLSDSDRKKFAVLLKDKKRFIDFIKAHTYANQNDPIPSLPPFFLNVIEADAELIDLLLYDRECLLVFKQSPATKILDYPYTLLKKRLSAALQDKDRARDFAQNSSNPRIILEAVEQISCNEETEKRLCASKDKDNTFAGLYELVAYIQNCKKHSLGDIEEHFNNMPTFKHMQENVRRIAWENGDLKLYDPRVSGMLDKALQKEKELRDAGYHVFYHGQRIAYALPEELATHIYGVENKIDTSNFLLLQVKPPVTDAVGLKEQAQWREKMVQYGNTKDSKHDPEGKYNRQNLLFLNGSLFHNIVSIFGSNSVSYAVRNDNAGNVQISLKDVFASFGHADIYEKFESMSNELEKDMQALYGDYGQLILVAIPVDKVSRMVYSTSSGGPLRKKIIQGTFFNSHTADSRTIVEALIKNPRSIEDHDHLEFATPVTWDEDGILNPQSGVQVHAFRPTPHASDEQVQAFEQKKKYYFDSVTRELKKEARE